MKTFALVGNPNCGKTTLFNKLTDSQEYVGNWSGVTVEKKQGILKNSEINIVDLPGIYSLSSYSEDEIIASNYLLHEKLDLIINIVDATNIERNLYLTTQLIEIGLPIIIVLNMMDEVEKHGDSINYEMMSEILDIPIVPISAAKSIGIDNLIDILKNSSIKLKTESVLINTEEFFWAKKIIAQLAQINIPCTILTAMKIIEGNKKRRCKRIKRRKINRIVIKKRNRRTRRNKKINIAPNISVDIPRKSWDIIIATDRYNFIDNLIAKCVSKTHVANTIAISRKIDKILVNKYLAIPIFLLIMFLIFECTFSFGGEFLSGLIENFLDNISIFTEQTLLSLNVKPILIDLVTKGIISGIGMILVFLPQIAILFFFLSFIEDSGYIARAAFIMDKPLRQIGLSGKSFVPMLLGFGCSAPAIMSARTLDNEKSKRLTIFLTPFISCSAKMPVYAILSKIFFPYHAGLVIFSFYLLGIILQALAGIILSKTILHTDNSNFIMELPPYRLPMFKNLIKHVYDRLKDFVEKAGSVLLLASITIWFMQNFNFVFCVVSDNSKSILGMIGKFIAPVFTPLGFGDWRVCVALLTGFVAKETIVSSLSILFTDISIALPKIFSPLSAYCYMVFIALYVPCIATIYAIKRETSWKLAIFSIIFQFLIAWIVSFIIFQVGKLFL